MELLEEKRLRALGLPKNKKRGLIIPIVYRGDQKLPDNIKSNRQYYLFEPFQISGRNNLDNPEYAEKIKEIAEYIRERHDELSLVPADAFEECESFSFPVISDITDWLKTMLPPKPVFPGRQEIK